MSSNNRKSKKLNVKPKGPDVPKAKVETQIMGQTEGYQFREEALPFVVYEPEKRQFELTKESIDFLSAIEGPIGIIAVAGLYRTGKSYLLNRMLLNRSNGFGVGPTINPCTKGLWVWGTPIQGQTPEGEPINVLIVDTEGLGALDEDSNHDVRIFSLAILLSSYFLYNSVGSIDESALSNLSLVINLTKNIQVKSKGATGDNSSAASDETDIDEYGAYFPSFMWVVRDFTLQLVDQEGEPLTPKEYLEKALEIQKGFSDSVEQKNRIRRLLKSFFKERDCCTMIRPLTREEDLQNLSNMELDELRGDFVEQVMTMRRKVVNKVKAKTLNGKKLSGPMLANLASAYVTAINNGAVPNIETAWSYICKGECQKALEESIVMAEGHIKEQASLKLPMQEQLLQEICKEAKFKAMTLFKKKAVGGNMSEEYLKELKDKVQKLCDSVVEENLRISHQACQHFLQESYSFIERKIKNREFPGGFAEFYDTDLHNFQQYFLEQGPPGPHRHLMLLEFVQRATAEAAVFFQRSISSELELQRALQVEQQKHLESQFKEYKQDTIRERDSFEQRMRTIENELAELSAVESTLRESVERLKQARDKCEQDMQDMIDKQKGELQQEINECKSKNGRQEAAISELQRKVIQGESESDKDRALLEQKVEFLERNIKEMSSKESDISHELKTQHKNHSTQMREIQQRYEVQVKNLQNQLDDAQEKVSEFSGQLESIEQKYNYERQQWNDSQLSLKTTMSVSQTQYSDIQKALDETKQKAHSDQEKLILEISDLKEHNLSRDSETEVLLKERDDEIKALRNSLEKETAIFKQKLEFKEVYNTQLKSQLEDTRKTHDQMVKAIESKSNEHVSKKEVAQKQLDELREIHMLEIQEAQLVQQQVKHDLELALEQMSEKHADLDLRHRLLQAEFGQETESMRGQIEVLEAAKLKAHNQNKDIDTQKMRLLEEAESRHSLKINELERELEDKETKSSSDLRDLQLKSEESLQQLRNFYEIEKERLESRLSEDRERASKKLAQQHDEYEFRLNDEQTQHEDEFERLQEEIGENQRQYQAYQSQAEHENALLAQKVDTLEAYLREKEERLSKEQMQTSTQMEAQLERFNIERKELQIKVEHLNASITIKDRELTISRNKAEQMQEDSEKRRKQVEDTRSEQTGERVKLNDKIDQLRAKNQELADSHMQRLLEDGRELALYKQKLEFQQKKIDDLQKITDEQYLKFEERFSQQKSEYTQELQESLQKYTSQREQSESKYEQKRRQFKEAESALVKQLSDANKERAVMQEKISNAELKKEEIRSKTESELVYVQNQLLGTSEQLQREREAFMQEGEKLRASTQEQERELSEVQAAYDRDRALWEGKFSFLESQRDQTKGDLVEATRKFEMTLEQLQKRGSAEKDKFEHSQSTLLGNIELKFRQQMKDQHDLVLKEKTDLAEKVRNLEKEIRNQTTRSQLEQRDKTNEQQSLQKRVHDLVENEGRLQRDIDDLKSERDRRIMEGNRNIERDRETAKAKMQEIDTKCKELETKRSTMIFEVEKERARWGLERDHILAQKQEVLENVERLQRKTEDLLKENEKLKSDRSLRKQQIHTSGLQAFNNQGYPSKLNTPSYGQQYKGGPASVAGGLSKENPIGQSQMFTAGFSKLMGGDGFHTESKIDPSTLPFTTRENHTPNSFATNIRVRMGSPSQQQPLSLTSQFLQAATLKQQPSALSSNGSSKSGGVTNITGGGPSSSNEDDNN